MNLCLKTSLVSGALRPSGRRGPSWWSEASRPELEEDYGDKKAIKTIITLKSISKHTQGANAEILKLVWPLHGISRVRLSSGERTECSSVRLCIRGVRKM